MDVQEVIKEYCKNALEVCDLVSDYFGEELVDNNFNFLCNVAENTCNTEEDIRNLCDTDKIEILVKFPKVRVTNENGNFIDITNLFVKIPVNPNGKIPFIFKMIRTEYTVNQWINNYSHSHLPFYSNHPEQFLEPCLGTGPIKDTIGFLRGAFNIQRWGLFCFELSKYVTVESLRGGPYRRLENLGKGRQLDSKSYYKNIASVSGMPWEILRLFIKKFIKDYNWKFKFDGTMYTLGEPVLNFWINISNAFIKWFNDNKTRGYFLNTDTIRCTNIFMDYYINNSRVYSPQEMDIISDVSSVQGMDLFMFKGTMQTLNIVGITDSAVKTKLLVPQVLDCVITNVLKLINSAYGRKIKIDSATEIL